MEQIIIRGGRPLQGEIPISGAKNAALPLMAASLLTDQPLRLSNLPRLADIATLAALLRQHGVEVNFADNGGGEIGEQATLSARRITSTRAPYELVSKMRASVLVLGPLVAREGEAEVSLPGGDAIGMRPVDLHVAGLSALGAELELRDGYIHASAPRGLRGAEIVLPRVSVGATENLLMAATLARGETRLVNAAREPEIVDLADCLTTMGAEIAGAGTPVITIRGRDRLGGAEHHVVADRIEAGTFAMAAAITDGALELLGARSEHLEAAFELIGRAGVRITQTNRGVAVARADGALRGADVMTEAYPGFPTDLQAQFMALMTTAEGAAMITETIFENRYMHVPELMRMGADITIHGASALVRGKPGLTGAPVTSTDVRASASLVLAGLAARGETVLHKIHHLDRGYARLERKLAAVGADIERISLA
jgi:UDP-N-acetylglucosamine 1-carboxyvinyltransferase